MKKIKIFLPLLVLFVALLFTISCEREVTILEPVSVALHERNVINVRHLNIDKLPDIQSVLSSKFRNASLTSRLMNTSVGSLNLGDILEYVNSDGKSTYTFFIEKEFNPLEPYVFENLHLIKIEEQYLGFILRYEPETTWLESNDFVFELEDFTGKQTQYDLDYNFIQETEFINGQIEGAALGGKTTDSSSTQRDWYYCVSIYSVSCPYEGTPDDCGGCVGSYSLSCSFNGGGSGDGNTGSGTFPVATGGGGGPSTVSNGDAQVIPILPPTTEEHTQNIINCLGAPSIGDLGAQNYQDWLNGDSATPLEIQNIDNFLQQNNCSPQAQAFAVFALETVMLNSDISIDTIFKLLDNIDNVCISELLGKGIFLDSPFVNTITDFLIKTNDRHLELLQVPENSISGGLALTDINYTNYYGITGNVYTIQIETNHLNQASDLGLIVTLYHELLHSYIVALYHENMLLSTFPTYGNLKTAIDNFISDPTSTVNQNAYLQENHNIYIDFIDEISQSILDYSLQNGIVGVDLEYSKKLVWGSLYLTDIFNDSTNTSPSDAILFLGYEQNNLPLSKSGRNCD